MWALACRPYPTWEEIRVEIDRVLPPAQRRVEGRPGQRGAGRHVVIVAWRDIASPQAGGSELLVDQLAAGLTASGDRVTLLCGGPSASHSYDVVCSGGPYSQFLGAPPAYWRRLRECDVVVEVCNGMPFLAPLWSRKPTICMVNHVHTDLWPLRFRPPLCTAGRFLEQRVMPWVHRAGTGVARGPARAHPHAYQWRCPGGPASPALRRATVPGARPTRRVQAHRPAAAPMGPGAPGGRRAAGHRGRRTSARLSGVAGRTRCQLRGTS